MAGSAYGKGREVLPEALALHHQCSNFISKCVFCFLLALRHLQYWDKRYKKDEEQFDWYQRYDTLKHILEEVTPKSMDRILMVGCGNSSTFLAVRCQ